MVPRRNMREYLFLTILAATSVCSVYGAPQAKGRKLFGGYRIVPKVCQPTNPSRIITDEPAICMFNYECTRRNGEVVGACMDGFLFGACCQLPAKQSVGETYEASLNSEANKNVYDVDHVPDLPILLNPDGTPMGMMVPQSSGSGASTVIDGSDVNNPKLPTLSDVLGGGGNVNTKVSTFERPTPTLHYADTNSNSEKTQIPQVDLSHLETDFPALLNQQSILDDLQLPGLITHSDSNNDIQDNQDAGNVDTVTTFLNPDQVLQIADPIDQLPSLFTQGLGKNNHSSAETILLNENGGQLTESNNPDDLFIPVSKPDAGNFQGSSTRFPGSVAMEQIEQVTHKVEALTQKVSSASGMGSSWDPSTVHDTTTKKMSPSVTEIPTDTQDATSIIYELYSLPVRTPRPTTATIDETASTVSNSLWKASSRYPEGDLGVTAANEITSEKNTKYISPQENEATTPISHTANVKQDELIRVPTITYDTQSGNKKHDVLDHEENSINHIISLLNNSNPTPEPEPFPEPNPHPDPHDDNSGIQTWVSIDGTSVEPPKLKFPTTISSATADPSAITFPYTFYTPSQYFSYDATRPTEIPEKTYAPILSTQGSYDGSSSVHNMYSNRPSTNPPAPTVIVLGPLGTEYITKVDTKPPRRPTTTVGPGDSKKPAFSTTITHNINTVISTGNADTNNTRVVSSSYISVDLKDGTTTTTTTTSTKPVVVNTETTLKPVAVMETLRPIIYEQLPTKRPNDGNTYEVGVNKPKPPGWSQKPTFHLKPSHTESGAGSVTWPHETQGAPEHPIIFKDQIYVNNGAAATPVSPEEETTAPDDFNNFPPVRNPNLNMSVPSSQQEKPTIVQTFNNTYYPGFQIIDENEIPTPAFIEDEVLVNKVDGFVDKIVESLQGNFDDLNEVIYKKKNSTSPNPTQSTTSKSPTQSTVTTKKPIRKPAISSSASPNKKPTATKRPPTRVTATTQKIAIASNKPSRPPVKATTAEPKPTAQAITTTGAPETVTKRPKPVRKPTVPTTIDTQGTPAEKPVVSSTDVTFANQKPNYKRDCGVRPMVKTGRIVGGKGAQFGEWPWQVLVREATWLGLFTKNKCGGVLITNKYVVTAAHCQPGFLASLVAVLGEFDITGELESKRSVSRNIRRVIVHRNYDPATFENDLALLEMETPIQFDTHIVPICMPDDNADFTGRMATVTGWGRLKYNGGVPSILQEVQVPIMENSVCQEMFQTTAHTKKILDSFLCAGYANGQKDSCEGDSGGPLVLQRPDGRWELAGTVSHGIKCAAPYLPGVYMRTTFFKPWLHSITGV